MSQKPLPYEDGMELAQYQGVITHEAHDSNDEYRGMEVNQYPGAASDDGSDKGAFPRAQVYEEDMRSRLHRDLKTRQIVMIALGGALGTGLLINT
jgi:amino acid transporter